MSIAVLLACLACVGYGRRAQNYLDARKRFAKLLLSHPEVAAFVPGGPAGHARPREGISRASLGESALQGRPAPRSPGQHAPHRIGSTAMGLVWPSPEAEKALREVDGLKLYPTHNWIPSQMPVVNSFQLEFEEAPVMIGVAGDSGCGKSILLQRIIEGVGDTTMSEEHTPTGQTLTLISLDDYHMNDRAGREVTGLTELDVKENDFDLMGVQMKALKARYAVNKPVYNCDTGFKERPELIQPNKIMVFEGLHPIYDEVARSTLDLSIYIDIADEVKFAWQLKRDVMERGWTPEQVEADMEKRLPDFSKYVDPQKKDADVILRYEPSDEGLPKLKVKLIQKKDGRFPMVSLERELQLPNSDDTIGLKMKMYDDDWYGNPTTVIEVDGEIDQQICIPLFSLLEANFIGLNTKHAMEFAGILTKTLRYPGNFDGTGILQTVIAMKVREVDRKSVV